MPLLGQLTMQFKPPPQCFSSLSSLYSMTPDEFHFAGPLTAGGGGCFPRWEENGWETGRRWGELALVKASPEYP